MRSKSRLKPYANCPAPNERPQDDSWVDQVADEIQALLAENGFELELVVFNDNLTEILHPTGFDGSPARYFRSLESEGGTGSSGATKGAEPVDLPPRRGSFTPSA